MKLPVVPDYVVRIRFGAGYAKGQCGFDAQYYDGWLRAICYGGTGFAIECKDSQVEELLASLMPMTEYEVIHHCNEHGWKIFDYYDNTVHDGTMTVHHFDENGNYTIIT